MRVNLALMNVKDSLAGSKTSSGGVLQTFRAGLCQGRASQLAELPAPAGAAGGAGHTRRGCWLPRTAASRPGSSPCARVAHRRDEVRQPDGKTSQRRLARRRPVEMLWPSVCSWSTNPAQPRPGAGSSRSALAEQNV